MIKCIIAVPDEDLAITETVGSARGVEHLATLFAREEVVPAVKELAPDVILLSPDLPGTADILDIAENVVRMGTRIVFLAGGLPSENPTIERLRRFGIQDILFDKPTAGLLIENIVGPSRPARQQDPAVFKRAIPETETLIRQPPFSERARELGRNMRRMVAQNSGLIKNLVAVWSPAPTGKTFVAVNLAAALAINGMETVLVDSPAGGAWASVGAPEDEDGYIRYFAKNEEPSVTAYCPSTMPGLYVFTNDPVLEPAAGIDIARGLEKLSGAGAVILLDAGADTDLLDRAAVVLIVADHDYNHLVKIQRETQQKERDWLARSIICLNRHTESEYLYPETVEQAAGGKIAAYIPDCGKTIFESQRAGVPAVYICPELAEHFMRLAEVVEKGLAAWR